MIEEKKRKTQPDTTVEVDARIRTSASTLAKRTLTWAHLINFKLDFTEC